MQQQAMRGPDHAVTQPAVAIQILVYPVVAVSDQIGTVMVSYMRRPFDEPVPQVSPVECLYAAQRAVPSCSGFALGADCSWNQPVGNLPKGPFDRVPVDAGDIGRLESLLDGAGGLSVGSRPRPSVTHVLASPRIQHFSARGLSKSAACTAALTFRYALSRACDRRAWGCRES